MVTSSPKQDQPEQPCDAVPTDAEPESGAGVPVPPGMADQPQPPIHWPPPPPLPKFPSLPPQHIDRVMAQTRQQAARLTRIAMDFVIAVGGMAALGYLADRLLGTRPYLMVLFAAMGVIGGGYRFVRESLAASRQAMPPAPERKHPGPQHPPSP